MQGTRVEKPGQLIGPDGVDGGYCKLPNGEWRLRTPNGHYGDPSNHEITEHEDGTITVSPSILISRPVNGVMQEQYHGYLERGVWRSC